jgi:hypothetical protein
MAARTLMVGALVIVGACWAPYTTISSNRSPTTSEQVTALFVISGVGTSDDASPVSFRDELVRISAACGLRIGISEMSRLDLDLRVHGQRAKDFGARHVLTLQPTERRSQTRGGWGGNGGYPTTETTITYDARLQGDSPDQLEWRAAIRLNLGHPSDRAYAAVRLANDIFTRLIAEGIVASCDRSRRPPSEADPPPPEDDPPPPPEDDPPPPENDPVPLQAPGEI